MTTSVVSIVYVNDAPAAARFYGDLLGMSPSFETPDTSPSTSGQALT
ncbi:hypothetical protein SALBM311S_11361 [Streptomyces alboniger]